MSKSDELLKMIEELSRDKTVQEIHEMIQKAIERVEQEHSADVNIGKVTEFWCLVERYLIARATQKKGLLATDRSVDTYEFM